MNGLFGRLSLLAGFAAAVLVGAAGPAHRFGYTDWTSALLLARYGVYAAGASALFAVLWLVFSLIGRSKAGFGALLVGIVLAGAAAYVPLQMLASASTVPMIHDITTDTVKPPEFVALMSARKVADNGAEYKASENAAKQQKAYPDIRPLITDVPPTDMFARAEKVARDMGWEIAAAEVGEGRIEATDTTAWWGFKDDIVIRITAEGSGSRLDIRSMSRVGKSDLGKNADRIRRFMAQLAGT